jgi:hypothetical protein
MTLLRPASMAYASLAASCVVAALAPTGFVRTARAQSGPEEHVLSAERLGVWRGYALRGHRIEAAFVSDGFERPGEDGYAERVEFEVAGPERRWSVRCTGTTGRFLEFSLACELLPEDGGPPAVLVYGTGLNGVLHGPDGALQIASQFVNTELLELDFTRPDGTRAARWGWRGIGFGMPVSLRVETARGPELDLITIAALTTLFLSGDVTNANVIAPRRSSRLDSYPLVPAAGRARTDASAALAWLTQRSALREAALLRAHLDDARAIDRAGGAFVERYPSAARIALGFVAGGEFLPDPGGTPRSLGGANLDVLAGARVGPLLLSLTMGLRTGSIDTARFAEALGVSAVGGAGFTLSIEGRYVLALPLTLEAVLGLQVGARLRFVDVGGWPEFDGATQWGFALAPILGLQLPIWDINDLGSRAVLALEGVPEWRFWADPGISAPAADFVTRDQLAAALSGTDLGVRIQLGIRLEL